MSYIPASDGGFDTWLDNFATLIAADPTAYGLVAQDGVDIDAENTAWAAAYAAASNPSTRTVPTVAAKDAARVSATTLSRSLAARVQAWPSITPALLGDLGLTVRDPVPTPIPAPVTFPVLTIVGASTQLVRVRFADELTPASRAKPFGATGLELHCTVDPMASADPDASPFKALITRNPVSVGFTPAEAGQIATFFGRWITRRGLVGPWSSAAAITIPSAG